MVNQELMQYVRQELARGESKDKIKSTLVTAGWSESDVVDSLGSASANPTVSSSTPASSSPLVSFSSPAISKPAMAAGAVSGGVSAAMPHSSPLEVLTSHPATFSPLNSFPQKVSSSMESKSMDIVKTAPTTNTPSISSSVAALKGGVADTTSFHMGTSNSLNISAKKSSTLTYVIGGVVIAALASFGVKFYFDSTVGGQMSSLSAQNAALNAQSAALTKKATDLGGQVVALMNDNKDLSAQVAFFATPQAASTTSSSTSAVSPAPSATIKGTLAFAKGVYTITTKNNVVIMVKNSKDAKVDAALKALLGSVVELSGTHTVASIDLTVTAVNGTTL